MPCRASASAAACNAHSRERSATAVWHGTRIANAAAAAHRRTVNSSSVDLFSPIDRIPPCCGSCCGLHVAAVALVACCAFVVGCILRRPAVHCRRAWRWPTCLCAAPSAASNARRRPSHPRPSHPLQALRLSHPHCLPLRDTLAQRGAERLC